MKLLDLEATLKVIEGASNAAILEAQAALPRETPGLRLDWLEYGVREGFYHTAEVVLDGQHVSTLFYAMDGPHILRIHGVHSRRNDLDLSDAHEVAFRRLAGDNGARMVQFETKRGGLIRKAVKRGYEICGVILRREITGAPQDQERRQEEQQNQSSSSSKSSNQASTTNTATNEQVAAESGGIALGAGSKGNTVNITTSDVNALAESQNVTDTALASNTEVTGQALAAGIQGLQSASALAQMGLAASAQTSGEAIASNTQVTGEALAAGADESEAALAAAQSLGTQALANGTTVAEMGLAAGQQEANTVAATSVHDLDSSLSFAQTAQESANSTTQGAINSALAAVLAGQANSSDLIQSVVNSNTAALENSNTLAWQTAAGATSQEGQIAGNATGGGSVSPFSITGALGQNPSTSTYVLVGAAIAAALVIYLLVKNEL
jgi:hypothetical protein